MNRRSMALGAACVLAALSGGCHTNSGQPPSVAEVNAQARRAREANEKRIDSIRNDPTLTADQKSDMIARMSRGMGKPAGGSVSP